MAKSNAERQAAYRARQAAAREAAKGAEESRAPERIDTRISKSAKDKLILMSDHTGQQMGIIVERALTEYMARHLCDMPDGDHYVYLREHGGKIPNCVRLGDRDSLTLPPRKAETEQENK